ncbi:MAG: TIGR02452 family protein [Ruminococcaceae bacterium]|nr:TIGR02452 family protein [Oscillospiraceae bacterium]
MNNIEVFNDTQDRIHRDKKLRELTEKSIHKTIIYEEEFVSQKTPYYKDCTLTVEENLTLLTARKYVNQGKKTAVLNFANPIEPGGGVLRGANAQEEYICRASNLYHCLKSTCAAAYYDYHNSLIGKEGLQERFWASDKIIYTPDVVVLKEDVNYVQRTNLPFQQVYTENWIQIDILSCAAPYFFDSDSFIDDEDLQHLFEKRIRNIFEVAIEHDTQAIVLGAFGCGVFNNPPEIVARAFKTVLKEERYGNAFENVTFAIKRSFSVCRNLQAFEKCFCKV